MKVREMTGEEIMSTLELPTAMLQVFDESDGKNFSNNVASHVTERGGYDNDVYTFTGFVDGRMTIVELHRMHKKKCYDWEIVCVRYGNSSDVAARLTACFADLGVCATVDGGTYHHRDAIEGDQLFHDYIEFYIYDIEKWNGKNVGV